MSTQVGKQFGDFVGNFIQYDETNNTRFRDSYMRLRFKLMFHSHRNGRFCYLMDLPRKSSLSTNALGCFTFFVLSKSIHNAFAIFTFLWQ